jgi:predicted O-methyltransferase YrrM
MEATQRGSASLSSPLDRSREEMASIVAMATARLERTEKAGERDDDDASYKLPHRKYPWSCTLQEGLILHYVIRQHGFREGYEMATAFGFSSLFMGAGLKANGGRLTSVDCYIEASKEDYVYTDEDIRQHVAALKLCTAHGEFPDSFSFARKLAEAAGLRETNEYAIGVSPDDIPELLKGRQIDVAFIDGGHFGLQPIEDFRAVLPFLAPRCAVFFHDNFYNEYIGHSIAAAGRALGSKPIVLNTFYGLTLVGRNLDSACADFLHSLASPRPFKLKPCLKRLRFAFRRMTGFYRTMPIVKSGGISRPS